MIIWPSLSLSRGPQWAALNDTELAIEELPEANLVKAGYFGVGDCIAMPNGRLYGVTQSGNRQTARVVQARKLKPTERFKGEQTHEVQR